MKKNFNEKCYSLLRKVPRGKVTTYKALAEKLGTKAYRAVGNAMNKNPYGFLTTSNSSARLLSQNKKEFKVNKSPYSPEVPCHRVVGADGSMTGFASGVDKKIKMLRQEGVVVVDGKVDLVKFKFDDF